MTACSRLAGNMERIAQLGEYVWPTLATHGLDRTYRACECDACPPKRLPTMACKQRWQVSSLRG